VSRRIGRRAILLLAASLLVGCNASAGSDAGAPSAPAGGVAMSAQNTSFDRTQVGVPAGRPFQLLFENRDGAPHNVTIFDAGAEKPLFVGETFSGPGSRTYEVPAIPAGTHQFRCDVHPQMLGTVTAG
jgi:plastocyanin